MPLFDANRMLGRRSVHAPDVGPAASRAGITVSGLLVEMDREGIAEALVYHAMAVDGHPWEGNQLLLRELAGEPRLHPSWVLLPTTGEMPAPRELVARMQDAGVRAARICPLRHRFLFNEANLGDLLAELEAARIPLLLDFGRIRWSEEVTDWTNLDHLCGRYPDLPFVLLAEGMAAPRRLYPLWSRRRNLYLETSYYQVHQGLSDAVRRGGSGQVLFGTGAPLRASGPALTQLRYDFLNAEEREQVGGGNLRRLLAAAHGGSALPAPPAVPSETRVTELPPHPILDLHVHLGTWFSTYVHNGEADGLVQSMDRLHIQAMALIAFDSIGPDARGGNERVAAAMRAHPGRFLGYCTVDPNVQPGEMEQELERCFSGVDPTGAPRPRFHAIKFHCDTHGYPADGDCYRPALEYADAHNLCVLIHGRITEPMLRRYPSAQFLSAHVGGWDGRGSNYAVDYSHHFANIHLDLAASTVFYGAFEKLVEAAGADRIVHGSDAPLMDPAYQLGRVLEADLSPEDREKILYSNGARLFHLPGTSR